jgi:hypothetical protein
MAFTFAFYKHKCDMICDILFFENVSLAIRSYLIVVSTHISTFRP